MLSGQRLMKSYGPRQGAERTHYISAAKWQANKHEVFFLFGSRTQDMKYVLGREFHIALAAHIDLYWGSECSL